MDSPDRTDAFVVSTLGLIGDFADTFKSAVSGELMTEWVSKAITSGRARGSSKQSRTNAAYALRVSCCFTLSLSCVNERLQAIKELSK